MYLLRFIFEMSVGAILFFALAFGFFWADDNTIGKLEKLVRNRVIGLIIALPALAACVPHAQIVAPGFLQNPFILWSLAIAIPILSYFYIDFYTARAVAGAIIILAYDLIHYAYDDQLPGAIFMTIAAWLFGFAAIWVSGKPHTLRDWFRRAAENRKFAWGSIAASLISAAAFVIALIGGLQK